MTIIYDPILLQLRGLFPSPIKLSSRTVAIQNGQQILLSSFENGTVFQITSTFSPSATSLSSFLHTESFKLFLLQNLLSSTVYLQGSVDSEQLSGILARSPETTGTYILPKRIVWGLALSGSQTLIF